MPEETASLLDFEPSTLGRRGSCLKVWKHPIEDGQYVAAADTSSGRAKSASCCYVAELQPNQAEVVACLWGFWNPRVFAAKTHALVTKYNHAYLCVEANKGETVLDRLIYAYAYENLYYQQPSDFSGKLERQRSLPVPGLTMSETVKRHALSALSEAISEGTLIIHDEDFFREASTYQVEQTQKSGREIFHAIGGKRDDRVMAMAILALMLIKRPYEHPQEKEKPKTRNDMIWDRIRQQRQQQMRLQQLTQDAGLPVALFTYGPLDDAEKAIERQSL